jgi:hypothetical protein
MARQVAIRLGTEGKAQVVADLDAIGAAGDASAKRMAAAYLRAANDADKALDFANRQATKLQAILPGLNPAKLDAAAGIRNDPGKSAEASASVFMAAYDRMEVKANALRAAIDPVFQAQQRFDREIAEARTLIGAGVISLDEYSKRAWQLQQGLDEAARAQTRAGASAGAHRMAMAGASYQVQDFITQVSMGANPINAFAVQSAQLAGQFSTLENRAGAVARFFMGPWGLAITAGAMILGPLVSKLWEESEADKAAAKAKEEHRKAVLDLAEAQEKAIVTAQRRQALDVAQIKIDLDAALATRQRAAAELEKARATAADAESRLTNSGGLAAAGNAAAAGAARDRVAALEAAQKKNDEEIARLQRGFDTGYGRMIQQRSLAASTPEGRINQHYDQLVMSAMESLAGVANGPRLRARLDELNAAREKELKAIQRSTQARDQETLTANSVAKMLRGELPGVHITSTTGGKHVANSYHYRNQAVDFVPSGGMSSMTKADVRRIFESRGIQIVELLGPGDKGHSDHFHVAWTKGKLALDEFTDAAKRAKEEQRELDAVVRNLDPIAGAEANYRSQMASIMKLPAERQEQLKRAALAEKLKVTNPDLFAETKGFDAFIKGDKDREDAAQRRAEFERSTLEDQRDSLVMSARELQLAGANDNLRDAEMNKLRLILRLKSAGVDLDGSTGKEIMANAAALDAYDAAIRRSQDAWQEAKRIGESTLDTLFNPQNWSDWGDMGKRILQDLMNDFVRLAALNPIKNKLFGSDLPTIGSVLGLLGGPQVDVGAARAGANAALNSIKISAPKFASGTEYSSGGAALLGEHGPEIGFLPTGSRVMNAAATRRLFAANDAGPRKVRVEVVPSPYFDVRVTEIAAPMSEAAAVRGAFGGSQMAQRESVRAADQQLY